MATVPPSGAPPTGTKPADVKPDYVQTAPPSGGGVNWPLILVGAAAVAGGGWWFTRSSSEQADVKAKGKELAHATEAVSHGSTFHSPSQPRRGSA